MSIEIFETRFLVPILTEDFAPKTFLIDTFFRTVETSDTELVEIHTFKGAREVATYVTHELEAKVVNRLNFQAKTFKPPYVKEKMATNVADILRRQQGEIIYQQNISPMERALQQLERDLFNLTERFTRLEEKKASQVLETGKVTVKGEGVDAEIDFQMSASHIARGSSGRAKSAVCCRNTRSSTSPPTT